MVPMSLFDTLFLLAQTSAEQPSSGGIFFRAEFLFCVNWGMYSHGYYWRDLRSSCRPGSG